MGFPASEVGYTLPCPGGKNTKSIRTCGGTGGKEKKKHFYVWGGLVIFYCK